MSANRGRYAEGKIQGILKEMEGEHLRFTFNRILDAHAAGHVFSSQPGDYQWFYDTVRIAALPGEKGKTAVSYTRNGVIEVKETEHAFRLAHKNFSSDKVARMRKRQLAGSECLVVVCHRVYGSGEQPLWRFVEFDYFLQREGGSWDLTDYPTFSNKELGPMFRQVLLEL